MHSKKILLAFVCCLLVAAMLFAGYRYYGGYQDTDKDDQSFSSTAMPLYIQHQLQELSSVFDTSHRLWITGKVHVMEPGSDKIIEETDFRFIKEGADIYSSLGNTEELKKDDKLVFIDNDRKLIIAYPQSENNPQQDINQSFFGMYKRLMAQDYLVKETMASQHRTLRFYASGAMDKASFEISYDTVTARPIYFASLNYGNVSGGTSAPVVIKMILTDIKQVTVNAPPDENINRVKWNNGLLELPAALQDYQIHYVN
jgi:hypothetical protein